MCHVSLVTCHLSPVTYHLSLMPTATDPHPANSLNMHSRLVCEDPKTILVLVFFSISSYLTSQLSTCLAKGPNPEQHTKPTWEAHLKCPMPKNVGRYRWGWHYRFCQYTCIDNLTSYLKKSPNNILLQRTLEDTARYVGLLPAPAEGFGLRPWVFLCSTGKKRVYYAVLAHFGPSFVSSRNLGNF